MKNKRLTYTVKEAQKKLENYCVYQDRCHQEVENKLNEMRMIPEAKELILLHLMEHKFLNEERFSKSFARGKFRIKKWGKQRIIRELKFRDISAYNIKKGLKEIDHDVYLETLKEIAIKKRDSITEKNPFKKSQKITNFLLYRGFENDLVYKVVQEIMDLK
ncbi:MAG: regulatory protein RecX [Candidatus Cloacimonetes bacterium]|nr:regulatory protein RecX [Candidatus Cloacimonadota bacterium]